MKRIIFSICLLFMFTCIYALSPVKENAIVIDLKTLKSMPEDNIKIFNKSNISAYKFAVYGYSVLADEWLPINKFQQKEMTKSPDSCFISFNFEEYHVTHIAVGIDKGFISKYSTNVKGDDLLIIIENIDTSSNKIDDCSMTIAPIQHEIKKVISVPNIKKNVIYDSVLSACVDFFVDSKFVIEHKDKESGTIKGKTNRYIFSIEVRDEKYRISVKDDHLTEAAMILQFKEKSDNLDLIFNTYASGVGFSENKLNSLVSSIDKCIRESDW